jgi:hypothetical protein
MRSSWTILVLAVCVFVAARAATYSSFAADDSTNFANPARGFFHQVLTMASSWTAISSGMVSGMAAYNGTVIRRNVILDSYVSGGNISDTVLALHAADFATLRAFGMKVIYRYQYTNVQAAARAQPSMQQILWHIAQLAPLWQANSDVILSLDAGFVGVWGEWYYVQPDGGVWGYYPFNSTQNANRRAVVDAMLAAVPSSVSVGLRTPYYKQSLYALTTPIASPEAAMARVSYFDDCFLADSTDTGTWNQLSEFYFMINETQFTILTGETCAVSSLSGCQTAPYLIRNMHWTTLNRDYNPSVITAWQSGGCLAEFERNLGYRFQLTSAEFPDSAPRGGSAALKLVLQNVGYAAPAYAFAVEVVFFDSAGAVAANASVAVDTRLWNSGIGSSPTTLDVPIPTALTAGATYSLALALRDPSASLRANPAYAVRFANVGVWHNATASNLLSLSFRAQDASPVTASASSASELSTLLTI